MEIRCHGCMQVKSNSPICEHCGYDERSKNSSHQLPVGTVVGGQYTLGKALGQGGFGITYIGWDNTLQQRVAVKEFFPSGYAGRDTWHTLNVTSYDNRDNHAFESSKRRFLREAEALAKLWNIPQIVKVLRHFEENNTAYIAMEFVEGEDLLHYLQKLGRPMTVEEILQILGPIMEALTYVHNADLVHRDISPDNIMVLPDGSAKLLDFGAARYVENPDAVKDRNTSTQAILKHGFAPPEQYRSHGALGPWTDVYAVCATIYYCMTGKRPTEAMNRMIDDTEVGWEQVPGLSTKQRAALTAGMDLKPKNRLKSVEELYQGVFGEILAAREEEKRREAERIAREEEERKKEEARQAEAQRRREEQQRKAEEAEKDRQLRLEEQRRREQEREEAQQRRAEEARKKEEARKAEARQKREEKQKKQHSRQQEKQRRTEETLRKKQARQKQEGKENRRIPAMFPVLAIAVLAAVGLLLMTGQNRQAQLDVPSAETTTAVTDAETVPVLPEPTLQERDWRQNVLMDAYFPVASYAQAWYDYNRQNLESFHSDQDISLSIGFEDSVFGVDVTLSFGEYKACLGSFPVFETGIPRGQIVEAVFLDSLAEAPADAWDVSAVQNGSVLAWVTDAGEEQYTLFLAGEGGINGGTCRNLFFGYTNLRTVRFNGSFHTEQARDMSNMFHMCCNLNQVDLHNLDTSSVTSMASMFQYCTGLTSLDLSGLDTSQVTELYDMFQYCTGLTSLNLSGLDTSRVTGMGGMFSECAGLTSLDLSGLDTSQVTYMAGMFSECKGLTSLDLSGWDTGNVTSMRYMFYGCTSLTTLDVTGFDTSNVTDMAGMFRDCTNLTYVDVSGFDMQSNPETEDMFRDCNKLPRQYKRYGNS